MAAILVSSQRGENLPLIADYQLIFIFFLSPEIINFIVLFTFLLIIL